MPAQTEWKVGTIIRKLREEQKITLEELSFGLCSPATLSRIENGEREMKAIFFSALFERLGYYPDGFELYVGEKEYRRYEQQRYMRKLIRNQEIFHLKTALEEYEKEWREEIKGEPLEQQFVESVFGYVLLNEKRYEEALEVLEKALQITVPTWKEGGFSDYAPGETELRLMSRIADANQGLGREKQAYGVRKQVCRYLNKKRQKIDSLLELYTVLVCKIIPYMLEQMELQKALMLCQNAEEALSECGRLYHWEELLYWKGKVLEVLYHQGFCAKIQVIETYRKCYYISRLLGNPELGEKVKEYLDTEELEWGHIRLVR